VLLNARIRDIRAKWLADCMTSRYWATFIKNKKFLVIKSSKLKWQWNLIIWLLFSSYKVVSVAFILVLVKQFKFYKTPLW